MPLSKLVIPSNVQRIEEAASFVEEAAEGMDFDETEVDNIVIAITEAISNAIIHANKNDHGKKVTIEIECNENEMITKVTDEGPGFDPKNIADPLHPDNLLKESGRGIFILNSFLDSVDYSFSGDGTVVTMVKKLRKNNS
jgi:serine/threonine-protein kinase RsbW